MNTTTLQLNEEKDKKRSMAVTFGLHAMLLLFALLPLLSNLQPEEPDQAQFVMVDFTDFKPASREGARPQKAKTATKKAKAKKSVPKAKPVPKPKPVPETKPKEVLTSPTKEEPIKTSPEVEKTEEEAPLDQPTPEDDTPEAPAETEGDTSTDDNAESTSESGATDSKETAESGQGKSDKSDGKADEGIDWGEVTGEGLFSRRVIYRADVKKITEDEGKIVVRLCVNRSGRVIFAENDDATTMDDLSIVRKAIQLTTKYRFEKDYTAPEKQCGKLTYIFEIEKE